MNTSKPNTLYWVIAIIALLWNLIGVFFFIFDNFLITEEILAAMPEADRNLRESAPAWGPVVYGIATIGGVLASICMLMRRKLQIPLFLISLLAIIVQMGYGWVVQKSAEVLEPGMGIVFPAIVVALGLFFFFYSKRIVKKEWLG
ncbi:hypothetical protein [Spongiimicrobium salis]|uniref:hypothetical protein n=1 Tax=Spongiimicrobium salis TaxID=1667022 RepID=UPI00374DB559